MKYLTGILIVTLLLLSSMNVAYAMSETNPPSTVEGDGSTTDIEGTAGSFESCTKAGNPVMESYPRQCRDKNGITYTEDINEETETREQRIQRMLTQFGAGDDIPRIGFYFAEGVTKAEAKKILAKYGLTIQKVEHCGSSGEGTASVSPSYEGEVAPEPQPTPIPGEAPKEPNTAAAYKEVGPAIRAEPQILPLPTEDGTDQNPRIKGEQYPPTNCEIQDDWGKIIETDKEHFTRVEVPQGSARRLAGTIMNNERAITWAEPDYDVQILGGLDIPTLGNEEQDSKKTETKEERLQRLETAFENLNIKTGTIIITFKEGIEKETAQRIIAKQNMQITQWEPLLGIATISTTKGTEKETAKKLVEEHTEIYWAEPDYEHELAKSTEQENQKETEGFFKGIWNWFKGIF